MHIPYQIEQSTNKHSRAYYRNGKIIIRLARKLSKNMEQEHIHTLYQRMIQSLKKREEKIIIQPFNDVLTKEICTVHSTLGNIYIFKKENRKKTQYIKKENVIHINLPYSTNTEKLIKTCWQIVIKKEKESIEKYVNIMNQKTLGVRMQKIRLTNAKSRWGSCSTNGNIMINAVLLFLPIQLLEYVIIHELAHCIHHNHSSAFWNIVEKHMPDYKNMKKKLQKYELT